MLAILQDFPCNSEYLKQVKESIATYFVFLTHLLISINFLFLSILTILKDFKLNYIKDN